MKWIRQLTKKVKVSFRKNVTKSDRVLVSPDEIKALAICRHLLSLETSKLYVCPETGKRFIENKSLGFSVIIKYKLIEFYDFRSYSVPLCVYNHERIVRFFDKKVGILRQNLENEMKSRVEYSFTEMFNNVFNK